VSRFKRMVFVFHVVLFHCVFRYLAEFWSFHAAVKSVMSPCICRRIFLLHLRQRSVFDPTELHGVMTVNASIWVTSLSTTSTLCRLGTGWRTKLAGARYFFSLLQSVQTSCRSS
jgi:hypothetical protein